MSEDFCLKDEVEKMNLKEFFKWIWQLSPHNFERKMNPKSPDYLVNDFVKYKLNPILKEFRKRLKKSLRERYDNNSNCRDIDETWLSPEETDEIIDKLSGFNNDDEREGRDEK